MKISCVSASGAEYFGLNSAKPVDRRRLACFESYWAAQGIELVPFRDGINCDLVYIVDAQTSLPIAEKIVRNRRRNYAVVSGVIEDVVSSRWASLSDELIDDLEALAHFHQLWNRSFKGRIKSIERMLSPFGICITGGARLNRVLARSDLLLCTSEIQAAGLRCINPLSFAFADCIPDSDYEVRDTSAADQLLKIKAETDAVLIVWEGTAWGLQLLELVREPLQYLVQRSTGKQAMLVFVGPRMRPSKLHGSYDNVELLERYYEIPTIHLEWSFSTIGAILRACDIGIAPMPTRNPFYRAKAFSKPLVYMSLGLPVIASSVPSYRELIRDGQDGFIACDKLDWYEKLRLLVNDIDLRQKIGLQGRIRAENYHSIGNVSRSIAELFGLAIKANTYRIGDYRAV